VADGGGKKRVLAGDAERWANLASLRVFNKPLAALTEDFERAKGGMAPETLASLIELGKEIEAADASRVHLGSAPTPPARRRRMTQFQMLVGGVLAIAVVGGFWSTRWVYYDQKIGGVTGTSTVRANRWTGARQTLQCVPVLNKGTREQIRSLQAQLATIIETWPRKGLAALAGEPSAQQRRLRPCPECPINYEVAPQVASELPFSQRAEVQRLLQRLSIIEAENWHCGWK
jgi:hypothetical protein